MRTYRHLLSRAGTAAAALGVTLALAAPMALSAGPASATESAFCHTLLTFHSKQPTGTSYTAWRNWAKTYLPFWEKLASEAPSASTKAVLNELVTILKYSANAKNYTQIGAYVAAHEKWWVNGWKAYAHDVMTCATSYY